MTPTTGKTRGSHGGVVGIMGRHYAKRFRTYLSAHGCPAAREWRDAYVERFRRYMADADFGPDEGRFSSLLNIYSGLAAYEIMRENGLTADEGIAAYDYMALPMRTFARRIHLMADSLPNGFRTVVKSLTDDMDGPKGICWDVDEIERSDEAYEYKIHSCLYCDVCAEHGYPEFATVFCNHDIWAYGSLHKHVRFERFGTLADGDACCHDAFHRVP